MTRRSTSTAERLEGADLNKLAAFSQQRKPLKLKGLAFGELFVWLSKSVAVGRRQLTGLLESDRVRDLTHDDTTLILAARPSEEAALNAAV